MGVNISSVSTQALNQYDELMLPSPSQALTAKETWDLIENNKSPAYLHAKNDPSFECVSCLAWFYKW
jgi:hypothetical protein